MIRTAVLRSLVLTAAFAAALTPVTCLGENSNRLPTKAAKKLPPELLWLLRQKKMPVQSPILVRIFKEEAELEVWKQDTTGRFQILKTYPICRWSGDLGPKLQEGDRQTPEGFYRVTPELMNPHSNYYLAINIGYPNNFDKANNRDGSLLMTRALRMGLNESGFIDGKDLAIEYRWAHEVPRYLRPGHRLPLHASRRRRLPHQARRQLRINERH